MRSILVTVMLLMVSIVIYLNTIGGEDGTGNRVKQNGSRIGTAIQSIDP
jgi:hypothetical protein